MLGENVASDPLVSGRKLFYRQPELLSNELHGSLGLSRPEQPFAFARTARAVPLTLGELPTAQRFFPVIFSEFDKPVPLAILGITDDVNLFVDEHGQWESGVYIPAYARCYPFTVASRSVDQLAVVIDRAAESVTDSPEQPFFEGDKVTPATQSQIDFCGRYDAESKRTEQFSRRLVKLGLLAGQQVTRSAPDDPEQPLANYVAVDSRRLNELEAAALQELFANGYLAAIFAHLFSLDNWRGLVERHQRRTGTGPA